MEVDKLLDLAAISRSRVSFISEIDLILVKICLGLKPFLGRVGRLFPYNIRGTARPYADQAFSCESGVINLSTVY